MSKVLLYFIFFEGSDKRSYPVLAVSLLKWSINVQGGDPSNFLGYVETTCRVFIILSKS